MHNFDKMQWMEKSQLKRKYLLRKTNPENFSSIGQILLKISFLKGKNRGLQI